MDKILTNNILRFVLLLAFQIAVVNNIHIYGYMTPYVYIAYLLLYPYSYGMGWFLVSSFFLGLTVDIFEVSGGIHAMSCVMLAFVRNTLVSFFMGIPKKEIGTSNALNVKNVKVGAFLLFASLLFTFHFTLYFFEFLSLNYFWDIIILSSKNTLLSASLIFITLVFMSDYKNNRNIR